MRNNIFQPQELTDALSSVEGLGLHLGQGTPPEILSELSRFSALKSLSIAGTPAWQDTHFAQLLSQHPALETLSIGGFSHLKDKAFEPLGERSVRKLLVGKLDHCKGSFFAKLHQLEALSLRSSTVPDAKGWQGLTSLRSLQVLDAPLDTADLEAIAALPELREFELYQRENKLPANALAALAKAPKLERVMLRCRPLSKVEGAALAGMTSLRSLVVPLHDDKQTDGLAALGAAKFPLGITHVPPHPITDALIEKLPQLVPNLQALDFDQHQVVGYCKKVTPTGLAPIAQLNALRWLNFRGMYLSKLRNEDLDWLPELTKLEALSIGGIGKASAKITDTLSKIPSLRSLDLSRLPISDASLKKLQTLSLQQLYLMNVSLTDKGFANLGGIKSLERLEVYLEKGSISDAGLKALEPLKKLQCFGLQTFISKTTISTLASLATLPALREFEYAPNDSDEVPEAWVTSLCASKTIEQVDLSRMNARALSDVAVDAALACPSLHFLSVAQWKFSPQARTKLETAKRPMLGTNAFRPYEPLRPTIEHFTSPAWNVSNSFWER